jgi:hypothetical protein
MKDILSKLTEIQGNTEKKVTATGKKVLNESAERPYVCVHAKKGKCEVKANSSYEAAKKAADKWKLKSTAGIDAYVADKPISTASLEENTKPSLKNIFNSMVNENQNYTSVNIANNQSQILDQDKNIVATVATNKANQTMQDLKTGAMQVPQQSAQPGQPVQPNQQQMQETDLNEVEDDYDGDDYDHDDGSDQYATELYGLHLGDVVKANYNGKTVIGKISELHPTYLEVELELTGRNEGKTVIVDVRETEYVDNLNESSQKRLVKKEDSGSRAYKIYKDMDWDEYIVKFYENGKYNPEADYHTDDKEDAFGTAKAHLSSVNEGKKAKPDFLDLDKDGNKKESMKKAAADKQKVSTMKKTNEAKAKPDFLDLDKDGDKKEPMKKAAADAKKKVTNEGKMKELDMDLKDKTMSDVEFKKKYKKTKAEMRKELKSPTKQVNESMNKNAEAARFQGKADALAKVNFNSSKYDEGSEEITSYLEGYKEGLDDCYGSGSMGMDQMPAMVPGMDAMGMDQGFPQDDFEEDALIGGTTFDAAGSDDFGYDEDEMAFEDWNDDFAARSKYLAKPKSDQAKFDASKRALGIANRLPKDQRDKWNSRTMSQMNKFRAEKDNAFEAWDRELNALLNEGKMKDIDIDMKEMSDAEFKKEHSKSKAEMRKHLSGSDKKKTVKEGVTVAINKDIENAPDSVTVTAQGDEADQLMAMIKQAGLGLFGGDDEQTGSYGAPMTPDANTPPAGDIGDHDSMMALLQKMTTEPGQDYEDEESMDDVQVHGHPAACGDEPEPEMVMDEDESEDEMEFQVAEETDSEEAETTADEDAEAEEDKALAGADSGDEEEIDESYDDSYPTINGKSVNIKSIEIEGGTVDDTTDTYVTYAEFTDGTPLSDDELNELSDDGYLMSELKMDMHEGLNEWANDANNERIEEDSYYEDIDFMTKVISGGLNNQKQDQTTLPHTKVTVDDLSDWKKLSGLK